MKEQWKPVVGYESLYEVSSRGRVRNVAVRASTYPGRMLKVNCWPGGYSTVRLCDHGRATLFKVHRIVAGAFLGLPPKDSVVHHKDRNRAHNNVDNLCYYNLRAHAVYHGGELKGELSPTAKLKAWEVIQIRNLLCGNVLTQKAIAAVFGVTRNTVSAIYTGRIWSDHRLCGGRRFGVDHPNTSLSEADVRSIKHQLHNGEQGRIIAHEFGVTDSCISAIKHGRVWNHVEI